MENLRGKMVLVKIYKTGTSKVIKRIIGKCKHIHTATSIRDEDWIELVDAEGKPVSTVTDWLSQYYTVELLKNKGD